MTAIPVATVVVAVEHGADNLPAIIERLRPAAYTDVDVLICAAAPVPLRAPLPPNVSVLTGPPGSRIPHLWRDGIVAARSEKVALTTAHCVPDADWVDAIRALELAPDAAAAGGHFHQAAGASGVDWAIFLLRYVTYSRPVSVARAHNVAADNAVYRRSAVMACADLLPGGFWEPPYHDRFAQRGQRLTLVATLGVEHRNRYSAGEFAAQRRAHAREFGADRAARAPAARRLVLALGAPLGPLVLGARVLARTARHGWLFRVPPSTYAWLAWFIGNWGASEAAGTWRALLRKAPA